MRLHTIGKISGFTLLEILIVLVLVGIFVTLAVVQHSTSNATLVAQCQVLKSHLRYAQSRSIDSDVHWGIYYHYSSGDPTDCYYLLFNGGDITSVRQLPGETRDRVYLGERAITLAAAAGSNPPAPQTFQIEFDDWGRPASPQLNPTGQISYTLVLTQPGQTAQQFVITQNTGFID
jgi:MSHA pilin protein MshC